MTRTTHDGERPAERRLRQALEARAAGITMRELRPADPPGPGLWRSPVARLRGFTLPLSGLAAAAALVGYLVLTPDPAPPRPTPPAAPRELTPSTPAPERSPYVTPSPPPGTAEPAEPTAAPGPDATPSYPHPRATPSVTPTPRAGTPSAAPSASSPQPPGGPSPSRQPSSPAHSAGPGATPSSPGQR
ncbi:hypothetical protein [Streptomyces sp. H27-S2]|uniref:hypothetical protein n=1 Tax=Streptomyces antarcticus TaxID=2996458 RepID=UPI0022718A11|nr:hypothetical protein [Streptomyces sp. H27-S2]MCY0950094.1 hypothetical protein [Streptomyces sp. H27-S2]